MHEAITRSRGLIVLFTDDYLRLPYTRKEFTSFEAQRLRSPEERHVASCAARMRHCKVFSRT